MILSARRIFRPGLHLFVLTKYYSSDIFQVNLSTLRFSKLGEHEDPHLQHVHFIRISTSKGITGRL